MMWTRKRATGAGGHVDAETLGLVALAADQVDPDVRAHIDTCAACARRLATLETSLAEARTATETRADEHFTPRRLVRQYNSVMRRLDPDAAPARVLAFPSFSSLVRPTRMVARRWVAAAAVVGLLSGLAAGRLLDNRAQRPLTSTASLGQRPEVAVASPSARPVAYELGDDEQFLVELDAALLAPRIEPLRAIEALTPRAGDLGSPPR